MIKNIPFLSLEQAITKAHISKEIKFILLPLLQFRLYVRYNGRDKKTGHYYGNEHQCTYNQCLYQKIPFIILNKKKGFDDLVWMVENRLKGQYISAKLYMRSDPYKDFDILCREYYKGGIINETVNNPILFEDEVRTIHYTIDRGRVIIVPEDIKKETEGIDFKNIVKESLS